MDAVDWTADTMQEAAQMKSLKRDLADNEPSVSDLGKFDPDDFDSFEDAFLNLLAQSYGSSWNRSRQAPSDACLVGSRPSETWT